MATNKTKKEKRTYNEAIYIKRLKERKEEYKKRLEYVASFKLPSEEEVETVEEGEEGGTGSAVGEPAGGIGNFQGTGELVAPAEHKAYRFTSAFGGRPSPGGGVGSTNHQGVDLAPNTKGATNCKILAAGDGIVIKAGTTYGFGTAIVIKHKDDLYTLYGHMPLSSMTVKVNDVVKKGQHIAYMGMEGNSTGVHLHFETHTNYDLRYKGGTIDPETVVDIRTSASNVQASGARSQSFRAFAPGEEEEDGHEMHGHYDTNAGELTNEEREADHTYRSSYPYKEVKMKGDVLKRTEQSREAFLIQRIGWARTTKYESMKQLNKERFIHQAHYDGHEGNLYSPDAKRLFENLLLKTKKPYFKVISGFRFSECCQLSPHEAGCAMDILVEDYEEVREIADCAWLLGIRSIAMGGDFENKKGFIHLDIAPKGEDFTYEGTPLYGGPGKWEIK